MPFNSETGSAAGKRGGAVRKDPENVRNTRLTVTVTKGEYAEINEKAEILRVSKADLVVRAVSAYGTDFDSIAQDRLAQWKKDNPDKRIPGTGESENEQE